METYRLKNIAIVILLLLNACLLLMVGHFHGNYEHERNPGKVSECTFYIQTT